MRIRFLSARYPAWVVWLVGMPLAVTAVLLAVFFLTFFLVSFGLVAIAVGCRLWWLRRRLARAEPRNVIEGEYDVVTKDESAHERPRLPE